MTELDNTSMKTLFVEARMTNAEITASGTDCLKSPIVIAVTLIALIATTENKVNNSAFEISVKVKVSSTSGNTDSVRKNSVKTTVFEIIIAVPANNDTAMILDNSNVDRLTG